jgi:hypothetical protein
VAFLSNRGYFADSSEVVAFRGAQFFLPNHTVVILNGTAVVFNTSAAADAPPPLPLPPRRPVAAPAWGTITEAIGAGTRTAAPAANARPLEMLNLTNNEVDYMYYSLQLDTPLNASELKVSTCGGEYVYAFAREGGGGALVSLLPAQPARAPRDAHAFSLPGEGPAATALYILVSAMGLSTSPRPGSCKGLTAVAAGKRDLTLAGWASAWVLPGEEKGYYTPAGAATAPWAPVDASGGAAPTSWFRATFDLPPPPPASGGPAYPPGAPPQLAYAMDLLGATKGVLYVNGVNLGRYNLELGQCSGPCAPPQHGSYCYIHWHNCGLPTQRFYHVPSSLLVEKDNLVVLFEETALVPVPGQGPVAPSPPPRPTGAPPPGAPRNLATVQLVALTEHPN